MGFFSRRNKKARARPPAEPDWVAAIAVKMEDKMEDEVTLLADWMNGAPGSDAARLLALMMRQRWACTHATLENAFPEVFVNTVIDDMNEVAVDELDTPLIYEDDERDDWWIVDEHFRDELAHILNHADFRQQK